MRYIISAIATILFVVLCLYTCPVQGADLQPKIVVETEKATLWKYAYEDNGGVVWVCHWLQNKKLVSGKLHSGLTCTPWVYQECVCPEPCPNPDAHIPPSPLF